MVTCVYRYFRKIYNLFYVFQNQVEKREFAKPLQSVPQQLEVFGFTDNVHTVCLSYAVKKPKHIQSFSIKGLSYFPFVLHKAAKPGDFNLHARQT